MPSVYSLKKTQDLSISLEEAWSFFSNPRNLAEITPDYLNFKILNDPPEKMHVGAIIVYRIQPVARIPIKWVTEITHLTQLQSFVDEQRFGPYKFWHHRHTFEPIPGGVRIGDVVHYAVPLGPLGAIANAAYVGKSVKNIFEHRFEVLKERFGSP